MPLPKPSTGEDRGKFVKRCMGNSDMLIEYSEEAQRFAVCNSIFSSEKFTDCIEELKNAITDKSRDTNKT